MAEALWVKAISKISGNYDDRYSLSEVFIVGLGSSPYSNLLVVWP